MHLGQEQFPHPAFGAPAHRVAPAIPAVEVADHRDALRVGRPDGECRAARAIQGGRVGAQLLPGPQVPPFGQQPDIHVAQPRAEAVSVLKLEMPVAEVGGQSVSRQIRAIDAAGVQAQPFGVGQGGDDGAALGGQRLHRRRPWQEGAKYPGAGPVPVRTQVGEGVAAAPRLEGLRQNAVRLGGRHGWRWKAGHGLILASLRPVSPALGTEGPARNGHYTAKSLHNPGTCHGTVCLAADPRDGWLLGQIS